MTNEDFTIIFEEATEFELRDDLSLMFENDAWYLESFDEEIDENVYFLPVDFDEIKVFDYELTKKEFEKYLNIINSTN